MADGKAVSTLPIRGSNSACGCYLIGYFFILNIILNIKKDNTLLEYNDFNTQL